MSLTFAVRRPLHRSAHACVRADGRRLRHRSLGRPGRSRCVVRPADASRWSALPDASVRESRDRVRSAIRNSGFEFPAAPRHRQPRARRRPQGRHRRSTCRSRSASSRPPVSSPAANVGRRAAPGRAVARRRASSRRAACCRSPPRRGASASTGCCCRGRNRARSIASSQGLQLYPVRSLAGGGQRAERSRRVPVAGRPSRRRRASTPGGRRRRFRRRARPGAGAAGARDCRGRRTQHR